MQRNFVGIKQFCLALFLINPFPYVFALSFVIPTPNSESYWPWKNEMKEKKTRNFNVLDTFEQIQHSQERRFYAYQKGKHTICFLLDQSFRTWTRAHKKRYMLCTKLSKELNDFLVCTCVRHCFSRSNHHFPSTCLVQLTLLLGYTGRRKKN